jgi:hypothetical protein
MLNLPTPFKNCFTNTKSFLPVFSSQLFSFAREPNQHLIAHPENNSHKQSTLFFVLFQTLLIQTDAGNYC